MWWYIEFLAIVVLAFTAFIYYAAHHPYEGDGNAPEWYGPGGGY